MVKESMDGEGINAWMERQKDSMDGAGFNFSHFKLMWRAHCIFIASKANRTEHNCRRPFKRFEEAEPPRMPSSSDQQIARIPKRLHARELTY